MHQMPSTITRWWDRNDPYTCKLVRRLDRAKALQGWLLQKPLGWLAQLHTGYIVVLAILVVANLALAAGRKSGWVVLPPLGVLALLLGAGLGAMAWQRALLAALAQRAYMQKEDPAWQLLAQKLQHPFGLELETLMRAGDPQVETLIADYLLCTAALRGNPGTLGGQTADDALKGEAYDAALAIFLVRCK